MKAGTPVVRCSPWEDKDLGTTKHRGSRIETNLRETMHLAKQMMYVPDDLFDQDPGINCMLLMTFRRLLPDCFCSQGNDRSGRVLQTKKEMPNKYHSSESALPCIMQAFISTMQAVYSTTVHSSRKKLTSSPSSRARVADAWAWSEASAARLAATRDNQAGNPQPSLTASAFAA